MALLRSNLGLALVAFLLLYGALIWVLIFVAAPLRHKKVAALADLFDAGTAKIDGSVSIRKYYLWPSVAGLFHGRPASVSVQSGFGAEAPFIRISVAGRFVLPFQVRAKKFSKWGIIRGGLRMLPSCLYFLVVVPRAFVPRVVALKFFAPSLLLAVPLISVWRNYEKIGGIEFPKDTRVHVSFPGSAALAFGTDFLPEFRTMIDRTEIQGCIVRLIEDRRVDHLRAVVRPGFKLQGGWNSNMEANFFYRRKLLHREFIREILIQLLALTEHIESSVQANEVPEAIAPHSA